MPSTHIRKYLYILFSPFTGKGHETNIKCFAHDNKFLLISPPLPSLSLSLFNFHFLNVETLESHASVDYVEEDMDVHIMGTDQKGK